MGPEKPLPFSNAFANAEDYIESLLHLVSTNDLLRTLCGGVHILDFFTSEPDLYARVIPTEWRDFFAEHEVMDLLDLFMRQAPESFLETSDHPRPASWLGGSSPPQSLVEYIHSIRVHLLNRQPTSSQCFRNRAMKPTQKLTRSVAVGMTIKKIHEVGLFASYVNDLTDDIRESAGHNITHLVDFGSGQNYLGRALASEPYNKDIIAIESKQHNAEKAKEYDIMAKLKPKVYVMRNKKAFRAGTDQGKEIVIESAPSPPSPKTIVDNEGELASTAASEPFQSSKGNVQYVEHRIQDGDLAYITEDAHSSSSEGLMVVSLHSCGNLIHHGLRSIVLNPQVKAIAMVGCCYNLMTERLGPATYKLPELRPNHPRLKETGEACDPSGFPMSDRLCQYGPTSEGLRLNITSRMMAVQAPQNWGESDSESFFTRHFYRALLQRVFLDRGVIASPSTDHDGGCAAGNSSSGTPIIIGSLRKSCYATFVSYVRGALAKLLHDSRLGPLIKKKMSDVSDEEIADYEVRFGERKKDLSVIWSLMAFTAGVIEATIVVDRWLWLTAQDEVKEAWVESVFDYNISPRNLVVVGIKR